MNNEKLTVLFYLQRNRTNKKGKCPLRCRLTFLKKRKQFSTGLFINPNYWKSKQQKSIQLNESTFINNKLNLIRQELNQAYLYLQVSNKIFDVEDIYSKYKGESIKSTKTLLEVFKLHNKRLEKLVGKGYSLSTLKKFYETEKHIKSFIKKVYQRNDLLLEKLTLKHLDDLEFYLKDSLGHKQITINKIIQRVRKIIKLSIAEGFLLRDPFLLYKPKKVKLKIIYLSPSELSELENYTFRQVRLVEVRDLFIFCCYTGLAYQEMSSLTRKHIIKWKDENLWISMYRKKTDRKINIPLLPKAISILEKYNFELPSISNQKMNSYLKEIAEIVGIDKNITHHIARKTFATTILLYNNVPIEIVSKLLGHAKIRTTQEHYGEILQSRLSEEMRKLKFK